MKKESDTNGLMDAQSSLFYNLLDIKEMPGGELTTNMFRVKNNGVLKIKKSTKAKTNAISKTKATIKEINGQTQQDSEWTTHIMTSITEVQRRRRSS